MFILIDLTDTDCAHAMYVSSLNSDISECESQLHRSLSGVEHDGAGTPVSSGPDCLQEGAVLGLSGPIPWTGSCRRGSQLCREGQGWGTLANTNDTCFILRATFFVGASVKNTRGQPSLSQKEGAQERGFLAAGFIKS